MSNLTRFHPFRDLEAFARRFDSFFSGHGDSSVLGWKPTVDVKELPEHFEVVAELPGIKKEDIEVTLDNGILTLSGERKTETEQTEAKMHRIERTFGRFERVFTLPETVDPQKVDAAFKEGVLTLKIGKRALPEKKVARIAIS